MGLSWGESDVTVDEYGFRFVLVFRKKNREATVTCLKQHENTIADVSIWLQGDTGFRRNYQQELGQSSEMYPCRSDLSRDVLHDLELFENEMNPQVLDSLLAVAFVYWKVSLSRCQKAAMRAAEFPFLLHKSSEEI